jgi:hypothetical protein
LRNLVHPGWIEGSNGRGSAHHDEVRTEAQINTGITDLSRVYEWRNRKATIPIE